jgi:transcription antitermination protein NusB
MPSRYKSRQRALQILFLVDLRKQSVQEAIASYYDSLYTEESDAPIGSDAFMEELAEGTLAQLPAVDTLISRHSSNWRIERMSTVDRNILRMAAHEMIHVRTPPPIVIDQALELARRFSGEESVPFINGVLDAVRRTYESGAAEPNDVQTGSSAADDGSPPAGNGPPVAAQEGEPDATPG